MLAVGGELKNTFCIGVDSRFIRLHMWETGRLKDSKSTAGDDPTVSDTIGSTSAGGSL